MKKYFSFIFLVLAIAFSGCDYVSNPYPEVNANIGDTLLCPAPAFPVVTTHVKKILLEDYTGHTCPNCPRAARILHQLDSTYPERIIPIGIHVGNLAEPSPGHGSTPATAFTSDFRTSTGDDYDAVFGAAAFGLPQGMFNRKDFDATDQTHLKFYPNWSSYITTILGEPAVADLQIINNFNDTTGQLCTSIKSSFLTGMTGTFKLAVLLVQDSIVDWQDDIDNGMVELYVHRHMLRDVISPAGPWGEELAASSVNTGDSFIKRYAYVLPSQIGGVPLHAEHCYVVAFIYRTDTYEVLQSEQAKVK
jgi:hypothetical protein